MQFTIPLNDFTSTVQNSVQVILGFWSVLGTIKKVSGRFVAYASICVAVPILTILIYYFRYRVKKKFPVRIKADVNSYKDLRNTHDKLNDMINKLQFIKTMNVVDASYMVRPLVRQMQYLIDDMEKGNARIGDVLLALDVIEGAAQPKIFTQIKESELWEGRPKVYQYRA